MSLFAKDNTTSLIGLEPMLQGPITNLFAQLGTNAAPEPPQSEFYQNETVYKIGNLTVFIEEQSPKLTTRLHKLFDILCLEFTKNNRYRNPNQATLNRALGVPLARCIQLFGLSQSKSSKDRLRIQIKEHLRTLSLTSFEWRSHSEKLEYKYFLNSKPLCEKAELKNGRILFTFSDELAGYLVSSYVIYYPLSLLRADEHNPNAYYLGRKLALHFFNANNQKKKTNSVLSVKSLLSICPNIPSYEVVNSKGRQYSQLIVEPFEKALDALPFLRWHYREHNIRNPCYFDFLKCYISFEISTVDLESDHVVPLYPPEIA